MIFSSLFFYKAFQYLIHGDYKAEKDLIFGEYQKSLKFRENTGNVLEIGCGDGNLAEIFPKDKYLGIDISKERIKKARHNLPEYKFEIMKAPGKRFLSYCGKSDFIFCYAVLHHFTDTECIKLLRLIKKNVSKGAVFLAVEPLKPEKFWRHPFWTLIIRMDQGKYIRNITGWKRLFHNYNARIAMLKAKRYWPVQGVMIIIKYN